MCVYIYWGFLGGSEAKESSTREAPIYIGDSHGKEFACNAGDPGSIPGLGRFLGEGNGYLFQYSCGRIPRTEEPGRLQSMGTQRVGHNCD